MSTGGDRAMLLAYLLSVGGDWVPLHELLAVGQRISEGYTSAHMRRDLRWLEAAGLISRRYAGRGLSRWRLGEVRALEVAP